MDFFKKNKTLLIVLVIICGLVVMWGRNMVAKRSPPQPAKEAAIKKPFSFFRKKGEQKLPEETIPVKVTSASRMDYVESVTTYGTIKGAREVPIAFRENGRIAKFYFNDGDEVKKGDLLVSLEQDEEKYKFEYAQMEYEKNKAIRELGGITDDGLRQAELEYLSANAALDKRNFYAPEDGFMAGRKAEEGELVEPSDAVATFVDMKAVVCEVGIIEKDIDKVKSGQKASIFLDAVAGKAFDGTVSSVSPLIEGRSRTQSVRIAVPNDGLVIKSGMFAKAQITTYEQNDAIVIPRKALNKTEEGYAVFGVLKDEKPQQSAAGFEVAAAKVIPVKVERATEEVALISEGLDEGQEIVLESPEAKSSIEDGSKVEILGRE